MFLCHFVIAGIFAQNQHQWATHQGAGWVRSMLNATNFSLRVRCADKYLIVGSRGVRLAFCYQLWVFLVRLSRLTSHLQLCLAAGESRLTHIQGAMCVGTHFRSLATQ